MENKILSLKVENGVGLVTISRPKAMNALNTQFFEEMDEMLDQVYENKDIKVMLITGDGKAFVAGADIAEMVHKEEEEGRDFSTRGQNTFRSMEKLPKPIIAAINGFALGGGMELTMACDVRFASTKAKFGQPEVNLGLIPGFAGTQRLPRLVGMGNALMLLMSGDMIGAQEAHQMGLVQRLFEPEQLMEESIKFAETIAKKGPLAVRKVKEVSRKGIEMDFDSGSEFEADQFGSLFGEGREGKEGMTAFLEKRHPKW